MAFQRVDNIRVGYGTSQHDVKQSPVDDWILLKSGPYS